VAVLQNMFGYTFSFVEKFSPKKNIHVENSVENGRGICEFLTDQKKGVFVTDQFLLLPLFGNS
jgi:hypothetical protein